jgi:bla regulator protein blaR1
LIQLGGQFAITHVYPGAPSGVYSTVEQVSVPFTRTAGPIVTPHMALPTPAVLMVVWLCGFVIVVTRWGLRWRQVCNTAADAIHLNQGREIDMLHSVQRMAGVRTSISLRLSPNPLEPGIFGIVRPALLWPTGFSERLQDAHLEAILTHEVWHVRRRDNLAAALHMLVEAVFWFHPLTWWLGTRLIEEREQACDERVLQLGSQPHVYAESILKTCEFCMEAPLACVAGVTGADLRHRVLRIATAPLTIQLNLAKKALLTGATIVTCALPISFGLLHSPRIRAQAMAENHVGKLPNYEVVSIKPSKVSGMVMSRMRYTDEGFNATNIILKGLIQDAYGVKEHQVFGAPSWLSSDFYDVEAKVESSDISAVRQLTVAQRGRMFQPVLADRLQLKVHSETREETVYELVVAKNGPKLVEAKPGDTYTDGLKGPDGTGGPGMAMMQVGTFTGQAVPLSTLVDVLSQRLGSTIVDKTGLTGKYDVKMQWHEEGPASLPGEPSPPVPQDSSGPSIYTALQEQLGLKLESRKAPIPVLVIDHVEKPSAN